MACGGGLQHKVRHVLIPTRGMGHCPKPKSHWRQRETSCNKHKCVGDEICVAKQDLIIAVDGSGSITEKGFAVVKKFATQLVERYQAEYFSESAMKIGLIQFGNGEVLANGVVSPAIMAQGLTDKIADVKAKVEGLTWKKGFTNMAQAFVLAERMFITTSRQAAQSSVLVITDGQPSFEFQTENMVQQLDDKGIMRFMAVITNYEGEEFQKMAAWASQPHETNLVHIRGIQSLEVDVDAYVTRALTKFCPMAISPSGMFAEAKVVGYMHVKDSGWCGARSTLLAKDAINAAACAALAQGAKAQSFLLGAFWRRGYCYSGGMSVDKAQYDGWMAERAKPACSTGWKSSMMYDFYALKPVP